MTSSCQDKLYLFGGDRPWDTAAWETTDDRVRGGSSISHLSPSKDNHSVRFHGNLDTSTLGGAGFASQQTAGTNHWDLSAYDGLLLAIGGGNGDGKRYVVTLKDEIPGRKDDGRMKSGVSWEAHFENSSQKQTDHGKDGLVWLPWDSFSATYRGRPKDDAKPLDLKDVKRLGLMMRSFFDEQHGQFDLELRSIAAATKSAAAGVADAASNTRTAYPFGGSRTDQPQARGQEDAGSSDEEEDEKEHLPKSNGSGISGRQDTERHSSSRGSRWWRGVFCGLL